jgi:hypothetical protein
MGNRAPRLFAKRAGIEVVDTFYDAGVSGAGISPRLCRPCLSGSPANGLRKIISKHVGLLPNYAP